MGTKLTYYDRQQIEFWLRHKLKSPTIAGKLQKDRTVIWREIVRNSSPFIPYTALHAQAFSERRAKKTNKRKLLKNEALHDYVVGKLKAGWSPEQIEGRLKRYPPPELKEAVIGHEAIYQFIYDEDNGEPHLYHQLRQKRWVRREHGKRKQQEKIPEKVSIHNRPSEINERKEAGHFESDSMLCKGRKVGLSVQAERKINTTYAFPGLIGFAS